MKNIPEHCQPYKQTPGFNEQSVPAGLLADHKTKAGTWGKIVVISGELNYLIQEPDLEQHILDAQHPGVVEPEILHHIKHLGSVRFFVEFYR